MDFAVPADQRVKVKETKKLENTWTLPKKEKSVDGVSITIIVVAFRTVPKYELQIRFETTQTQNY